MQVILIEDVKSLGKKGTIVNINDSYARNYVIPRKLGVEANKVNLNDLKLRNANIEKLEAAKLANARDMAAKMNGKTVKVKVKSGVDGRLFGAVTPKEVASAINEQLQVDVDKKKIVMDAIKELGTQDISIKLHKDVPVKLKVSVEAEK